MVMMRVSRVGCRSRGLAWAGPGRMTETTGLRPASRFAGLARGLQPQIPLLTVAEMSLADILPRHDRPRALAAEPLRHVTQLVGPGGEGVQLPVVRALLALDRQRPKIVAVVAPFWPSLTLCQRPPAFSAEDCVASGMVVFRRRSGRSVASGSEDDRADSVDANDGIEKLPSSKL
jgi:hypothetical protein